MRSYVPILRQMAAVLCLVTLVACSALCQNPPPEKPKAHDCCKRKAGSAGHAPETPVHQAHCKPQPWDVRKEVSSPVPPMEAVEAASLERLSDDGWEAHAPSGPLRAVEELHLRNRVLRI
ncbi:MAG: hypothetical protein HY820_41870 [Acidobacteria bacterium]|nr:hypothetical protein [Acidobacteriota bacterium]